MTLSLSKLSPIPIPLMGDSIVRRDPAERLDEEVYRSIPALSHCAKSALDVGNKLALSARNALFFDQTGDVELRALQVENALLAREQMESAQPDLDYLQGAKPMTRQDFETAENDIWLEPRP